MSLKNIKLVSFDVTNTLLKFRVPVWRYYTLVGQNYGFTGNEDFVKRRLQDTMKIMSSKYPNFGRSSISWQKWWHEVVKKTFEDHLPDSNNIDIIAKKLIDDFKTSKCWCVAPAAHELLKLVRTNVSNIAVISNFDPRLSEILQNVHIIDEFDYIVTSYHVGYSKPDKQIFTYALEQCKTLIKPSEALHIGDNYYKDYEAAKASGWHAILINDNLGSDIPIATENVFKDLQDLRLAIDSNKLQL